MSKMSKLYEICKYKYEQLQSAKQIRSLKYLKSQVIDIPKKHNYRFYNALSLQNLALIAEIKKSSPSLGQINNEISVVDYAKIYEQSGANAISVLTEDKFFGGSLDDLKIVANNVNIPILRKDFIFDEYQIYESIIYGADAILLIVNVFDQEYLGKSYNIDKMYELYELAKSLGLDVLVEVHNKYELEEINDNNAINILGINCRNLNDLTIDIHTFGKLSKYVDKDKILVAESGIHNREDVDYVRSHNADAILVGTSIMKSGNPQEMIMKLLDI
jgi:indole-3-glycerol phosphate synthase